MRRNAAASAAGSLLRSAYSYSFWSWKSFPDWVWELRHQEVSADQFPIGLIYNLFIYNTLLLIELTVYGTLLSVNIESYNYMHLLVKSQTDAGIVTG